ncbi:hypothetical protein EC973_002867 [Apophysomyces ossiformis]|uniref:CN hydrolase domain-containing protein n=1 Tax=Apophysomyces ossiformis TaxID=679940 RepID=A0A8H7END8_9FUNG|nr:hypothetical protein EC973_002867 [Apophysomyces ossiformis]
MWTGLWLLTGLLVGDYGTYSSSVMGWSDLIQIASLAGRPAIDFLMALFGTTLLELWTLPELFVKSSAEWQAQEEEENNANTIPRRAKWPCSLYLSLAKHPFVLYGLLMALVLTYGGAQVNIHKDSIFQESYKDYVPPSVPVGCLAGQTASQPIQNYTYWFNRSTELVQKGARIVLWSELTAFTADEEDETRFRALSKEFASRNNVYLAAAYGTYNNPPLENKLILVSPKGEILIDYNKAHPVPIVELQPPGEPIVQYVDTEEFGRVGLAICFDYNFPQFIWQAGQNGVDLMLQASQTWGPMGTYHTQGNALRAVENGFTLFRCVTEGMSGVFEPTANGIFTQKNPTIYDEIRLFYLPLQKHRVTLYAYIGDTFGYSCLIASILATGYLAWKEYKPKRQGQLSI